MNAWTRMIAASAAAIGILSFALAQPPEEPETTLDQRLLRIELSLASLDNMVRRRTDVGTGVEDRTMRDLNVENRFREIESQLQQLNFSLAELQRQAADAVRIASQAQSDAQFAQQIARDAQSRVQ